MSSQPIPISIARASPGLPPLSALLDEPADPPATSNTTSQAAPTSASPRHSVVLLAHGSGIDIEHPWMRLAAEALAAQGFATLRFRYPYMDLAARAGKPRPPDRAPQLEEAHLDALAELRRRFPARRWLLAGKSLGARMATHIAAKGADTHGLVLFGYPLHPPRKPEKERSEHFATLAQPALFLHGTRDEFGTVDELRAALRRYSGRAELSVVDGADHSFALPASKRRDLRDVMAELAARTADWDSRTFPE